MIITGTVNETPYNPTSPPVSPLRATTRTLGQTTEQLLTTEPRTVERTTHMADVASETLLLNKIKKKLDSVLVRSLYSLCNRGHNFSTACNTVFLP